MKKVIFSTLFLATLWVPALFGALNMIATPESTFPAFYYILFGVGIVLLAPILSALLVLKKEKKKRLLGIALLSSLWLPVPILVGGRLLVPSLQDSEPFFGAVMITLAIGLITIAPLAAIEYAKPDLK